MATKKETAEAVEVVATETKKTTAKKAAKPAAEKAEKATTKKSTAKKAEDAAEKPAKKTSTAKKTTKAADAEVTEAPKAEKKTTKKAAKKVDTITIKLVRGFSHRLDAQIATCKSLGLRHIGDVTTQPDNAATKGKLAKISHMVEIIKEA